MENFNWITGALIPYANLALFLFLAFKIFKAPLLSVISGKRDTYMQQLTDANKAREEAESRHKELSRKLSKLNEEVEKIKEVAKAQAEIEAAKIVADAESLAKHLTTEAQKIAEAEVENAKASLRQEVISAVKQKVSSKILTELDEEKQKALFSARVSSINSVSERV